MRKFAGAVLAAICLATSSTAQAENYLCTSKPGQGDGWIPETTLFFIDEEKNGAAVLNTITLAVSAQPVPARLRVRNDGQQLISWTVSNLPTNEGRRVSARYRALFSPKTKSVNIKATIANGLNAPSGTGSCVVLDQKALETLNIPAR